MIVLTGNKYCSDRIFCINMARKLRFGIYSKTSRFGPSGLNGMAKYSTKWNDTFQRLNTRFGMNSLCMLKRHGTEWLNKFILAGFQRWLCSKASTKLGGLGVSFVEGIICILSGIGRGNVVSVVGAPFGLFVWGLSLAGGVGGDLGSVEVVGVGLAVFTWRCFAFEGPQLPSLRTRLSF